MEKLPKNIFFKKTRGRNGTYVYQKRLNGKRWEWARKDLEAILEVKKTVESYYAEHGEVPKILDPQADIDYKKELPIGTKVGEWTILEHISKEGRIYMKCECSCGEIREVYAPSLFKKDTREVSRAEFSRRYSIPVRTLEGWDAEERTAPAYVKLLLDYAQFMNL